MYKKLSIWLFVATLLATFQAAPADEDLLLIESLDTAIQDWINDVDFVCTYECRKGRAKDVRKGLRGEFSVVFPEKGYHGTYVKISSSIRCLHIPNGKLTILRSYGPYTEATNLTVDEVATKHVSLVYAPTLTPGNNDGTAVFTPCEPPSGSNGTSIRPFTAGTTTGQRVSPLNIACWEIGSYLRAPANAKEILKSVESASHELVAVRISFMDMFGCEVKRVIEVSLIGSVPVVETAYEFRRYKDGKTFETFAKAADFVECPGGPVPRVIRRLLTNRSNSHPSLPLDATEWRSVDLGDRPPTLDDFQLAIHPKIQISGLKDPSVALVNGRLDITRVNLRDLDYFGAPTEGQMADGPSSRRWPTASWAVIGIISVIALSVCIRKYVLKV